MREKIRIIRQRLGLTQEHFAQELGVSVATVNRWENGHAQPSRLARKLLSGLCREHNLKLDKELNLIDELQLIRASNSYVCCLYLSVTNSHARVSPTTQPREHNRARGDFLL